MRNECKKCIRNHDPTSLLKLKSNKIFQDDYVIFISGHLFFQCHKYFTKIPRDRKCVLEKIETGQEKLRPELNE